MARSASSFKYSGRIHPDDRIHAVQVDPGQVISPTWVYVPGVGNVPQYAPTVVGGPVAYNPPNDCNGNFMSCKFQPNNNCYNYSTDIATNSFAQPGRMHSFLYPDPPTGPNIVKGAQLDGLTFVGGVGTTLAQLRQENRNINAGHFVALMISPADSSVGWPGDYHWARCDSLAGASSWSQKDGGDQVTDFDFAGNVITDPTTANWMVNQGPEDPNTNGSPDYVVAYVFYAYMFVPTSGVTVI